MMLLAPLYLPPLIRALGHRGQVQHSKGRGVTEKGQKVKNLACTQRKWKYHRGKKKNISEVNIQDGKRLKTSWYLKSTELRCSYEKATHSEQ